MTFYLKTISYFVQDIKLRRKVIYSVLIFINVIMLISILPGNSLVLTKWHSTKDFILLFRYEFLHVPIFIIILGSLTTINDWILLRRYSSREQIANHNIVSVIMLSSIFTFTMVIAGSIYTSIVRIIPENVNYTALFLYEAIAVQESSFVYFIYVYIFLTTIVGLSFIALQNIIKNDIVSAAIIITLVIADRFIYSIIPNLIYISEFQSPWISFLVLVSILIILINLVQFTTNNKNFYVRDEKL